MTSNSKIKQGGLPSHQELTDFINGKNVNPSVRIAITEILASDDEELKEIYWDMVAGIKDLHASYGDQAEDRLTALSDEMYFPELVDPTADLTVAENIPELFFDSPKLKENYLDDFFLTGQPKNSEVSAQKTLLAKIEQLTDALEKMQSAFKEQTEKVNALLAQQDK